jgi:hypothetical protein
MIYGNLSTELTSATKMSFAYEILITVTRRPKLTRHRSPLTDPCRVDGSWGLVCVMRIDVRTKDHAELARNTKNITRLIIDPIRVDI